MIALEERFSRSLPVKFTPDELRGKADELADKVSKHAKLEEEKKQVAADYKARLDQLSAGINLLARHISEKCEYQQVECQAFLDCPDYGKKTIYRCDTGDQVGVETMTPSDRQTAIKWNQDADGATANPLETPAPVEEAVEQPIDVPVPVDNVAEPASTDDGVLEHDGGGQSHESEE